jgi:hypothetical protein
MGVKFDKLKKKNLKNYWLWKYNFGTISKNLQKRKG